MRKKKNREWNQVRLPKKTRLHQVETTLWLHLSLNLFFYKFGQPCLGSTYCFNSSSLNRRNFKILKNGCGYSRAKRRCVCWAWIQYLDACFFSFFWGFIQIVVKLYHPISSLNFHEGSEDISFTKWCSIKGFSLPLISTSGNRLTWSAIAPEDWTLQDCPEKEFHRAFGNWHVTQDEIKKLSNNVNLRLFLNNKKYPLQELCETPNVVNCISSSKLFFSRFFFLCVCVFVGYRWETNKSCGYNKHQLFFLVNNLQIGFLERLW